MAGVDIIVMSLWQVPDKETAEFMNLFYSSWLGGMKVREAFRSTQRTMSNKYKNHPEKWAAFVLFE
jgi:CHAT domain-containing protein